jgi:hypothetical protein
MYCTCCGQSITDQSIGPEQQVGWCPRCRHVFRLPLFPVRAWILGALLLLVIKLQAGI